jgi:hypothetical protein
MQTRKCNKKTVRFSVCALSLSFSLGLLGKESAVGFNIEVLNKSEELRLSTLFFVLSLLESNSDSSGDISNTIAPDELVELGVDADIGGTHGLLGVSNDFADSTRGLLLEGDLVSDLVEVDGSVDRFFLILSHFVCGECY